MPSNFSSRGTSQPTSVGFSGTEHGGSAVAQDAYATPGSTCGSHDLLPFTAKPAAFILGHTYPHGVWFYFPVLFLLKSPIAFLLLLVLALVVGLVAKVRPVRLAVIPEGMELHWRAVWVFLVVYIKRCMYPQ